jgi:V/A-type H+-transporting ATPase subunit K
MEKLVIALLISLIPMIPAVIYALRNRNMPVESAKRLVKGLGGMNVILTLMAAGFAFAWLAFPQVAYGMGNAVAAATGGDQYASLAAAISTGLACVGAGLAVGPSGAAAIGAIAEKPEAFGRSLIFVGLGEGIAIYGLLIAFVVLGR